MKILNITVWDPQFGYYVTIPVTYFGVKLGGPEKLKSDKSGRAFE